MTKIATDEDARICARFRFYGTEEFPPYWKTWAGSVEAKGNRVVLMHPDGVDGPWTRAPAVTSDFDEARALLEHVLPGWLYAVHAVPREPGNHEAQIAPGGGLWQKGYWGDSPAAALVLAILAEMDLREGVGA